MIKKFKKSLSKLNKYLILSLALPFVFLTYLSIPALYKYDSLQKELTDKILKDFNINLVLSNEIKYRIFPSPNFEISNNLIRFNKTDEFNKIGEAKKVKIMISFKNLYSQKQLEIKEIKFYNSNFTITKRNFQEFNQFLKENIDKKITIKNSKVFFKNEEQNEILSIATILNAKINLDKEKKVKKFNSKGSIFNTNYILDLSQNLENLNLKKFILNFKDLNFKIKNELSNSIVDKSINGQSDISILREKIELKYNLINNNLYIETEKNKNFNFSGTVDISPFYFNAKINLKKLNINSITAIISKLEYYLNRNYLLNKNFNGKLSFKVENLYGSKYFDKLDLSISFINGKIDISKSKLFLNKLGYVEFKHFDITSKKNEIFINTKNLFKISNLRQFNRVIQIPKNKKINIENIYFEIDKALIDKNFSIKTLVINDKVNNSNFDTLNLSSNTDIKNLGNIKNWFELKSLLRKLISAIN
ncbi:MAG: hypothetical protein CBE35_01170 [Candidatus Pelagibacter sp. TMED275]|nr:MAG: hypothetical protein CBE35_01170 [Candidatus Pelagibacter sp. TMED275]|tara:strand:- start:3014 stop:4441 length:1428 start_codon:yes stop_codon:yes gene_type:complete